MSTERARAHSIVVSLDAERQNRQRPKVVENAHSSGTDLKAEILSIHKQIESDLSPIVPEVRKSKSRSKKAPKTKRLVDEQYSIEQIGTVIVGMSAQELKSRFPKAWTEHQTLKRKTGPAKWDELRPAFEKFPDFLRLMGPAPHPNSTIDRIDLENPVYGPDLCRWASPRDQARNRSTNVWITWCGERHTLAEWAELTGISYETLRKRHQRGATEAELFRDARVLRYSTPRAPLVPPPAPTPIGSYTFNLGAVPLMDINAKAWPEGFADYRQYETGYIHATRRKGQKGRPRFSMTRAHFGAWIAGSRLKELQKEIAAAGLSGYVFFRERIPYDGIAEIDARACACPAIRKYYALLPFLISFQNAYLSECEIVNSRSRYSRPFDLDGMCQGLAALVKSNPCSSPIDAWKLCKG